jgi:hypothetical protein
MKSKPFEKKVHKEKRGVTHPSDGVKKSYHATSVIPAHGDGWIGEILGRNL